MLLFHILASFADEELPLDGDGAEILSETLGILSLKEIKLQTIFNAAGGAAGEEPEEEDVAIMAKAVLQTAQKRVVSQVRNDWVTFKIMLKNTTSLCSTIKVS